MTRLLQSSNSLKRMQTEKARMAGFCIGIDRVRILRSIRVACFVLLMLACVLSFTAPSHAAQFSGSYLLHICGKDTNGKELAPGGHIACQAYIAGILDYHNLQRSLGTAPTVDFCVPNDVNLKTLQDQVYSYVFRHQKQHNVFTAAPAVALAFYNFYPCKK